MRSFTVQEGVMGYVVSIGCQVAGFSTKTDLVKAVTDYITDPDGMEKKYYNPDHGGSQAIARCDREVLKSPHAAVDLQNLET